MRFRGSAIDLWGGVLSQAASGHRIGVIGSHGAVGRVLVALLRSAGYEVVCGNRTRRGSDEDAVVVDAHEPDSVRRFARGCRALVNCAGPSYLIADRVAAALPESVVYVDPFGGNLFEGYRGQGLRIVNAGCTPGLSGLLVRHLASRLDVCSAVTVCSGGREQGGVAGFADVILSTREGYGYPNQMVLDGRPHPYVERTEEAEDTDAFPADDDSIRSPFVTDELRQVAIDSGIPALTGILVIPDRDSLHLLLKAMTCSQEGDTGDLIGMLSQIDDAKSRLDAGKKNWFAIQVTARGYLRGRLQRSTMTVRSRDSSELTAAFLAQSVVRGLESDCLQGVVWGYELMKVDPLLDALRLMGVSVEAEGATTAGASAHESELIESGFL